MPYRLLYFYWKIHSWADKSSPRDPMPGVMLVFFVLSFFNITSILCFLNLLFGIDVGLGFLYGNGSSKLRFGLVVVIPWTVIIYALIKISKIKEKAFSPKSIQEYRKRQYGVSFIFIYMIISFVALIILAHLCGERIK